MKENYTDINIVLDRSGSMESVKADTIGGFNSFLKDQQAVKGEATLTLVQFDTEYEFVHKGARINDVPPLNNSTFVPRGGTALLDAIGRTINETGARLGAMDESARPDKVIFVILTDGEENSSKEFNQANINEMIQHQKETYQWEFVFLGANQDAIKAAGNIGIHPSAAMSYAANPVGTQRALGSLSANVASYRSGTSKNAGFSDSDRDQQKDAGAKY